MYFNYVFYVCKINTKNTYANRLLFFSLPVIYTALTPYKAMLYNSLNPQNNPMRQVLLS